MSKRAIFADIVRRGCDRDGVDYSKGYVMIYQHVSGVAGRDVLNTARALGKRPVEVIEIRNQTGRETARYPADRVPERSAEAVR